MAARAILLDGITYQPAAQPKGANYRSFVPLFNVSQCELLDLPRLVSQLCALERRTVRRRDSIDHNPGAHDDIANAVAGVLVLVAGAGGASLQSRSAWLLAKRAGRGAGSQHWYD